MKENNVVISDHVKDVLQRFRDRAGYDREVERKLKEKFDKEQRSKLDALILSGYTNADTLQKMFPFLTHSHIISYKRQLFAKIHYNALGIMGLTYDKKLVSEYGNINCKRLRKKRAKRERKRK